MLLLKRLCCLATQAEETANALSSLAAANTQLQRLEEAAQVSFLASQAAGLQQELDKKSKALDAGTKAAAQGVQREHDLVSWQWWPG